ncbi:MAG: response regulator [SAR324 cluster bacterium]|nr:response regulator [SAR324 cluster bacterium]
MATILIVDDDPQVIQQVQILLDEFGYETAFISRPRFLFQRLESKRFDLILMDIGMPDIDGLTLLKQLKAHDLFNKIPVIMLTGEDDENFVTTCFESGATDYINKPVSRSILEARIKTAITAHQAMELLENKVEERTIELQRTNDFLGNICGELERINKSFQIFVPKQFVDRILSEQFIQAGDYEEEILSILFADIRSYTNIAEQMSSEQIFQFLNGFYSLTEPLISKNHGFVDKFIGDAIMALFDQELSGVNAVRAAVDIQHETQDYNEFRRKLDQPQIQLGIGINTGPVMVGTLGSDTRMNSTVIGDPVNLASRLEALTKKYNARILLSHHTRAELKDENFLIREIDSVRVRGKNQTVGIYEIFDCDPPHLKDKKLETRQALMNAITLYKSAMFEEALEQLEHCFKVYPQDVTVIEHIQRCRYFSKYPPASDQFWTGVVGESELFKDRTLRRRTERFDLEPPGKIKIDLMGTMVEGTIHDISADGARVRFSGPLSQGETILLNLDFRGTVLETETITENFRVLGQIAWRKQEDNHGQHAYWFGISFTMMLQEQEEQLIRILNNRAS